MTFRVRRSCRVVVLLSLLATLNPKFVTFADYHDASHIDVPREEKNVGEVDHAALSVFYVQTNGDQWETPEGAHPNWMNDSIPYCSWIGVNCDHHGNVEELVLENFNLNGTLPDALGKLHSLRWLDLSVNKHLVGSLPVDICGLGSLQGLILNGTGLSGTLPKEMGNLRALTRLDLCETDLTGSIPTEIGLLQNLEFLDLDTTQLTGPIPPAIGILPRLKKLILLNTKLYGTIPPEVGRLGNLVYLNLESTALSGTIPKALGNLTKLLQIYLSDTHLCGPLPAELGQLDQLLELVVSQTDLSGTLPKELARMRHLTLLDISSTSISGAIPAELNALENLEKLRATSSRISSVEFNITEMCSLKNLQLSNCPLQYLSFFSTAASSSSLEYLGLANISMSTDIDLTGFITLKELDLHSNRIACSPLDLLNSLPKSVQVLHAGNALKSQGEIPIHAFGALNLPNMVILDLSHNKMAGGWLYWYFAGTPTGLFPNLVDLDVSFNELSGTVNEMAAGTLDKFYANENRLKSTSGKLPSFAAFHPTAFNTFGPNGSYQCAGLVGSNTVQLQDVRLDPEYYGYEGCNCSKGYLGTPPTCTLCPSSIKAHGKCEDGRAFIERGYYPAPDGAPSMTDPSVELVPCPAVAPSKSACNPDQGDLLSNPVPGFSCAPHNRGRLCTVCQAGYTMTGAFCQPCAPLWVQTVLGIAGIAFVLIMALRSKPKASAISSIIVFYVQLLATLLSRMSWHQGSTVRGAVFGISLLSGARWHMGLDCLGVGSTDNLDDYPQHYQVKFSLLIFSPFMVLVSAAVGWAIIRLVQAVVLWLSLWGDVTRPASMTHDIQLLSSSAVGRLLVITVYIMLFFYINISSAALEALPCTGYHHDHPGYMLNARAIPCDPNGLWGTYLMPIAVVMLVFFVLGLPAAVLVVLIRGRWRPRATKRSALWQVHDSMTSTYRDSCFYFQMFAYIRRLLVVLVLSVISVESPWEPVFICVFLLGYLILHLSVLPYRLKRDNTLESVSLSALLISYAIAFIQETTVGHEQDQSTHGETLELFVLIINGVVVAVLLLGMVQWHWTKRVWVSRRRDAVSGQSSDVVDKDTSLSEGLLLLS